MVQKQKYYPVPLASLNSKTKNNNLQILDQYNIENL